MFKQSIIPIVCELHSHRSQDLAHLRVKENFIPDVVVMLKEEYKERSAMAGHCSWVPYTLGDGSKVCTVYACTVFRFLGNEVLNYCYVVCNGNYFHFRRCFSRCLAVRS